MPSGPQIFECPQRNFYNSRLLFFVSLPKILQDVNGICLHGSRIARCMSLYFEHKRRFKEMCNSLALGKCLKQRLWDDSPFLLKQLTGIGMVTAKVGTTSETHLISQKSSVESYTIQDKLLTTIDLRITGPYFAGSFRKIYLPIRHFFLMMHFPYHPLKALLNAGISNFNQLEQCDPRRVELITGRRYPFGNQIKDLLGSLPPKVELKIEEKAEESRRRCNITLLRNSEARNDGIKHFSHLVRNYIYKKGK